MARRTEIASQSEHKNSDDMQYKNVLSDDREISDDQINKGVSERRKLSLRFR